MALQWRRPGSGCTRDPDPWTVAAGVSAASARLHLRYPDCCARHGRRARPLAVRSPSRAGGCCPL